MVNSISDQYYIERAWVIQMVSRHKMYNVATGCG